MKPLLCELGAGFGTEATRRVSILVCAALSSLSQASSWPVVQASCPCSRWNAISDGPGALPRQAVTYCRAWLMVSLYEVTKCGYEPSMTDVVGSIHARSYRAESMAKVKPAASLAFWNAIAALKPPIVSLRWSRRS